MSNMRNLPKLFAALLLIFFAAGNARAQLTLNIDSASEEIFFSGSDSGSPSQIGATTSYRLRWQFGLTTGIEPARIDIDTGFTFSTLPIAARLSSDSGEIGFVFIFAGDPGATSLTGNGARFSYASWPDANKAVLAALAGAGSMQVDEGSGTAPVQVNLITPPPQSVPTMSIWMLIALALGLASMAMPALDRYRRS
jgi:hypothetical protein